jgi:HrpA-like RNA helicase
VKLLDGPSFSHSSVAEFLNKAVEPPPAVSLQNAVRLLQDIGAFEEDSERLTVLGRHLAALPLPPRVGKMLLYAVLFGCLDPILTVTCCMAYRHCA